MTLITSILKKIWSFRILRYLALALLIFKAGSFQQEKATVLIQGQYSELKAITDNLQAIVKEVALKPTNSVIVSDVKVKRGGKLSIIPEPLIKHIKQSDYKPLENISFSEVLPKITNEVRKPPTKRQLRKERRRLRRLKRLKKKINRINS